MEGDQIIGLVISGGLFLCLSFIYLIAKNKNRVKLKHTLNFSLVGLLAIAMGVVGAKLVYSVPLNETLLLLKIGGPSRVVPLGYSFVVAGLFFTIIELFGKGKS